MNRFLKLFSLVFIGLFSSLITPRLLYAQEEVVHEVEPVLIRNAFALVPQYAFFSGIRVDYERRLKNSNHWLVLAPQIYLDMDNSSYYFGDGGYGNYQSMFGVGINAYYKTVVFQSKRLNAISNLPRQAIYISAGPNFQYFSLKNEELVARPYVDNGTTYYQFNLEEVTKPIYRFGAIANAGWQLAFDRFLLDLYLGIGLKYSLNGDGKLIKDTYSEWVRPTYSGILLDGGVRLGMFF